MISMRKSNFVCIAFVSMTVLAIGCKRDVPKPNPQPPTPKEYTYDVYVAGTQETGSGEVAMLWTNGNPTPLSEEKEYASALAVGVRGSDVYVAGNRKLGTEMVATLWKNTQPLSLPFATRGAYTHTAEQGLQGTLMRAPLRREVGAPRGDSYTKFASATALCLTDNDLYVVGYDSKGAAGEPVAMLWRNESLMPPLEEAQNAHPLSVWVAGGRVYVAGYKEQWGKRIAMLWENGKAKPLTMGSENAEAHAVCGTAESLYAVGWKQQGENRVAILWKDGSPMQLSSLHAEDAEAFDLCIADNKLYIVGYEALGERTEAMLWHDGKVTKLPSSSDLSEARAIYEVDGTFYIVGYEEDSTSDMNVAILWKRKGNMGDWEVQRLTDGKSNAEACSVYVAKREKK